MNRTQFVAHDISIPVRFGCSIAKSKWTIGTAQPLRWYLGYGGWEIEAGLVDSKDHSGFTRSITPEEIPESVAALLPKEGERLSKAARRSSFAVLVGTYLANDIEKPIEHRVVDQWTLREATLELEESTEALAAFLNRFGAWSRGLEPLLASGTRKWEPTIVGPRAIWLERARLMEALTQGAGAWFKSHKAPSGFYARESFPHYAHTDEYCADAIATSITVDFLRGVKFGICPRSDCRKPFSKERKGKVYCSQYCAHLVSVRRSRSGQS
jgi:hypothetical protein